MCRNPRTPWKRALTTFFQKRIPNQRSQSMSLFSLLRSSGGQSKSHPPELCIERPNGTYENIFEEELYRYTRHRWLFNEERELSKRYLRFNLQHLLDVALKVCEGARYCTKVLKCSEGLRNKAFILTMDNGAEVFAKLPNPNAGPSQFTTASEVATHELLRDVLKVPVPRILAWSSDSANNPVEAEYIISEKAPGIRLGSVWGQWPREAKLKLIAQIVDMENRLTTIPFPRHGCIYFKDDLRSLTGKCEDINIDTSNAGSLSRFSIGPLTSAELWEDSRREMRLDRGPWPDARDYTQALGRNEIAWIQSHARPRMNYYRSSEDNELPSDGIALLTQYMKVAPYLVPPTTDEAATSNVLWHPDLHLDNVFVDPETCEITCIVDWQSACVAPLFYQSDVPRMFRHPRPVREGWVVPERPENFDLLSETEKKMVDEDLESETIHKYYEAQVYKRAPRHWAVLSQSTVRTLRKPVWLVSRMWENQDVFFLRQSLISLANQWHEIFASCQLPCPIEFTDKDYELHSREEDNMDGIGQMLALFRDQGVLPVDGMVNPEDYEIARENNHKFKEIFIGLAKNEEERKLYTKLWPYQG
ncbi:phosphotransferase enzyme family protein [Aspergillus avenaceus]|uniref:Altered inheritance of mitochondria protein 9, mitochondrial n=1 Tax=Aspergillus avenaceus TaxID=36643 RepID=A0A5N6U9J8_ASPAV|nr:phosphotransferase enzyme family protein [Aspergillus avenaceus]